MADTYPMDMNILGGQVPGLTLHGGYVAVGGGFSVEGPGVGSSDRV